MKPQLRILHMLPDLSLGGGQVLLLRNILALRERDVHSSVCAVWRDCGASMAAQYEAHGVPVFPLQLRRSRLVAAMWRLRAFIGRHGFDVIHANNTYWDRRIGVIAGRLCRLPVVNSFHSMRFSPRHPLVEALDTWHLAGGFRAGVAVSRAVRDAWLPYMRALRIPPANVHTIGPGVALDRYAQALSPAAQRALRGELGIPEGGPLLVNVARMAQGKGHVALLQVMEKIRSRLPGVQLVFVGDGPNRPHVEAFIAAHGLRDRIHVAGRRDDVPRILALADAFLFASEGEGFGLAVAEAMACAKPVVAFDLPALREFIDHGRNGLLVDQGDTAAFADEVIALLGDDARRQAMGAVARQTIAEQFAASRAAAALTEVYRSVVAGLR